MTAFLVLMAGLLVLLAVLAAIADALDEPERRDARRRNR